MTKTYKHIDLPETKTSFKWAFIGDLQLPWTDFRAVNLWFDVMKWWKPAAIDITGDIDDQLEYSSFSDGTTDEFFNKIKKSEDESPIPFIVNGSKDTRGFFERMRTQHKNSEIYFHQGNHECRVYKYVNKKAPQYIDQITPELLWGTDSLGIYVTDYDSPPIERYAGIHVHHGTTVSSAGLAVKGDIENYGVSLVRGHDHRGGVVYKSYPMTGQTLVGMGTGHMCSPGEYGLRYTVNPAWELGFGIGHVDGDKAHLQFIPISKDYVCYVDGKRFQG